MKQRIAHVSLVVRDYDEAIKFFTKKLNFELVEDRFLPEENKRWVLISPPGSHGTCVLLARAKNDSERAAVGNQTGGRVFLFLYTDDFQRDYTEMKSKGIEFVREPAKHDYGTVAVFKDLYGNLWDLLEPAQ
jgi:catechol 2,3-dioxygenase-like lactoylglutathione lyase family enzyme